MASEIELLLNQFRQVNLREEVPRIIEAAETEIVERVQSQMKQGLLSTGQKITPSYKSGYYARKKFEQNSAPGYGTPDAYRTGSYYKSMGVAADQENFLIDANISRKNIDQYGDNLLRLSDENKSQFAQGTLLEGIKDRYKESGIIFG